MNEIHDVHNMTDGELLDYYKHHKKQATLKDGGQMVRKILLNIGHFMQ